MMYRILYNKQEIYGPTLDRAVLNPTLELELNTAGKLEFTLPVMRSEARDDDGNPIWPDSIWETIQVFNGEVEVWEEDDCIFFGRPLQIVRDWNNQKKVVCEGALAYFNDTVQPTKEYKKETGVKKTPLYTGEPYTDPDKYKDGFFNKIIEIHNDQLKKDANWDQTKSIFVGNIDLDNELVWRKTDFETTAECLQSMCLDTNGGYFILRKEWNEDWQDYKKVIDWYKQPPYGTGQEIIFGLNLLDINQDINGSDLCTVLYPTGDGDLTVRKATTRDWSNPYVIDNIDPTTGLHYETHLIHEENSPYIIHKEGYEKYGRVVKQKSFETNGEEDTHENANELWQKAREWLNEQNFDEVTIECSAADLHYVADQTPYREDAPGKLMLGQMVLVNDSVHGVTRKLPIYKLSMNLDSGVKKITMGTPPKKELTDIIKPSTSSSTRNTTGGNADSGSGSGGSGGGSVTIPVKDVQVKYPDSEEYASVVKKKVAKIDLTSVGKVDDVKVNGTSVVDEDRCAQIDSIVDILVNGASVVNPTDHKARINKSNVTYGTAVPLPSSGANGDVYYRLNQLPSAQTGYKFIKLEIKANKVLVSSAFDGFKFITADGTPMEWPSNASVTCDVSCTYGADAIFEEENPNKYVLTSAIPTFVIELQDDLDIYTYSKYRWLTSPQAGNNMHEPVSWNLYLSQDGTNWTLVDSVKNADIPSVPGELAYSGDINVGDIVMGMITDIYVKANGIWTKEHFKYTAGDGIVINENNVISLGTMTPPKLVYCMHKNENPNINNENQYIRAYTNISAPEASTTYSVEDRGLYICSLTCWTSPSDSSAEVTDMDILCYEHSDPTNTKPPMFNVEIGKSIYRIFWAEPGQDIEFVSQGTNVYSYKSIALMKNVDYHDIVFRRCYDSDGVIPPDYYYPEQPEKGMYPNDLYDGYNTSEIPFDKSVKAYRNYRKDVFYLLLVSSVGRIKYGTNNYPDYPTTSVGYNNFSLDAVKGYRYKDDYSIIEFTGETDDRFSGRYSKGAQQGYVAASSEYFLNEDFFSNIYSEYISFAEFYLTPSMSEVEANPPDAATETLEKLRVNGTTYGVSGGGSGSVTDVQVKNSSLPTYNIRTTSTSDRPSIAIDKIIDGIVVETYNYRNDEVFTPVVIDNVLEIWYTLSNPQYYWHYKDLIATTTHAADYEYEWYYTTTENITEDFASYRSVVDSNGVARIDVSGGGGGGSDAIIDTLYDRGNDYPSSSIGNDQRRTYNINSGYSFDDYDAIYVMAWGYWNYSNQGHEGAVGMMIFKDDYYKAPTTSPNEPWSFVLDSSYANQSRMVWFRLINSTTLNSCAESTEANNEPIIFKILGINFKAGFVTEQEFDYEIAQLQANFQDGVDDIYDACVAKGSTPASHSLSDVVTAIGNISGGGSGNIDYYSTTGTYSIVEVDVTNNYSITNLTFESEAGGV